jgi:hypothetical protein
MKILSLILILFLALPSFARESRIDLINALRTDGPSLLNSYLDLMAKNKILDQASHKLKHRQLLKRDGGLCAFTANTDAIEAVSQYYQLYTQKFVKRPDYFLYQVIDEARGYMEEDPTHAGISFEELVQYTREVFDKYGLNDIIHYKIVETPEKLDPDNMDQQYWKLRLMGMVSQDKEEGHTIVVLRVNKNKKTVFISDPNWPNKVLEIPYKKDHGKVRLYLDADQFPGFHPATMDQVIEITIPRD